MMLGEIVVQHQRGAVDLQMGMHQPAVVRGMAHQLLGAERSLVEVDRLGGAAIADGEMGRQPALGLLEFKVPSLETLS